MICASRRREMCRRGMALLAALLCLCASVPLGAAQDADPDCGEDCWMGACDTTTPCPRGQFCTRTHPSAQSRGRLSSRAHSPRLGTNSSCRSAGNFDGGTEGMCERCLGCAVPDDGWAGCGECGLPDAGAASCSSSCRTTGTLGDYSSIGAREFSLAGSAALDEMDTAFPIIALTMAARNQAGQAWYPLPTSSDEALTLRYEMYTGDGSGADGQCVSVGANDLGGRNGEDGVGVGVAVCFDEYSNGGDHGISIFYNGETVWETLAPCENQEGCEPVSLFADGAWHVVELSISPTASGGAVITFDFGHGVLHGFARIPSYTLPSPAYLGFTARTGGATNSHWVKAIALIDSYIAPPPPAPPPPLPVHVATSEFALTGSAVASSGDCVGGDQVPTRGWEHSAAICNDVRIGGLSARLCTADELSADEARGTGCMQDDVMTWTNDPCGELPGLVGHYAQRGSSLTRVGPTGKECYADSETFAVRCCAEGAEFCAALHDTYGGWPAEGRVHWDRGSLEICGESDNGIGGIIQLTQVENDQQGTAFVPLTGVGPGFGPDFSFHARFEMYTGEGTGADGMCVNVGAADLGGRAGEDGVAEGVAVCFDEWANGGDHGGKRSWPT